ncbi:MAG: Spy/CpxP family protein refolding chaperone [Ignavibacteriae bacterium]|nr:Spy/CpxP family protein refolding chaperone [Ignavibacteriota bacterium]
MKYKQLFLTILFLTLIGATAFSQEGQMRRGEPRRMEMEKRLNLSDDQRDQIQQLRTEFQKQQITQRGKIQLARIELRELLRADKPDKSAIEKKIQETSQLQAQQQIARVNHMLTVRNVLTPEQQKIMREEMRGRFHDGFRQRRPHMRGFRGGSRGHDMRGEMLPGHGFGDGLMFGHEFDSGIDGPDDDLDVDPEE